MRHNFIRHRMIALLIGLVALAAGRAYAQEQGRWIEVLSDSWGFARGDTARISVTLQRLANLQRPAVSARIQLLDTEGRVISQSDVITVEPGQIRFWDAPRDLIPASGEPRTGRLQVRTRIVVTAPATDFDPDSLMPTIEIIDGATGRTLQNAGKRFSISICGESDCGTNSP
jgi:hypothetical protein